MFDLRFPADGLVREKWLKVVRRQRSENDWMPSKFSTVCSEHFHMPDRKLTKKGRTLLKKNAVPFIAEASQSTERPETPQIVEADISDLDSIFDSPRKAFLKAQVSKLSEDKLKLKKSNSSLKRKNKYILKKYSNLKKIVLELKKKYMLTENQMDELSSSAELVDLKNRLFCTQRSKLYRKKYTPALRKFAVTLHYYSPAAYKYVRQVFNGVLPHPRVIGRWYENSRADPGFSKQALDTLIEKFKATGKRLICSLVADEMALRHQAIWTGKKTVGVVDFGAGPSKSSEIATQAYVFNVVCMNENWMIPVAYFLVNGLSAETRANLIKTCLKECYSVGVDIFSITFDGCSSNINAANLLGCNLKDPYNLKTTFKHPSGTYKVAILLDACHMIKLVRNTFEAKRLIYNGNGKHIRWQFLIDLLKLQKNLGLNFANKLTARHIHFRNEVMKVKLATQVMSMSVANALKLCSEIAPSPDFSGTEHTVEFIELFNNLFDIFNSRSSQFYGMKKPLSAQNAREVLEYLDKVKNYILGLSIFIKYRSTVRGRVSMKLVKKNLIVTKSKTGFLGFLVCIESLRHLYSSLILEGRMLYIATYRLSQDHIEMLFGLIRRHGGYNNNPNVIQFKGIFKKILHHLELKSSFLGNCIPLEKVTILTCSSAVQNINKTVGRRVLDEELIHLNHNNSISYTEEDTLVINNIDIFSSVLNSESSVAYENQIVGYISGWVSRVLSKSLKCEPCINSLFTVNKLYFHKLINLKNKGGLCFPSEDVYKICLKSESALKIYMKENGHIFHDGAVSMLKLRIFRTFVTSHDIFPLLHNHSIEFHPTFNHRVHIIPAIIEKYLNLRLHYAHKINSKSNTTSKRPQRNKLTLFEGS